MRKIVIIAGYLILSCMTLLLFSFSLMASISHGAIIVALLKALILASLLFRILSEWPKNSQEIEFGKADVFNFLSVVSGALVTYALSTSINLGAVLSAALVGIIVALLLPKYGVATYCGAFVGMCSSSLLPNHLYILLAAVIAGAVFVATKTVFNGFGGKLGTIAFTGGVSTALFTNQPLLSSSIPSWDVCLLLIIYAVIGAVATMVISLRLKHGPVMASGIVALTAGLLLPAIHPETGSMLAVMVTCATFAGMSSYERMPNEGYMVIAGIFTALVFIFTQPHFGGAGGKLGTIAFGSVMAISGMLGLFRLLKEKSSSS